MLSLLSLLSSLSLFSLFSSLSSSWLPSISNRRTPYESAIIGVEPSRASDLSRTTIACLASYQYSSLTLAKDRSEDTNNKTAVSTLFNSHRESRD